MSVSITSNTTRTKYEVENGVGLAIRMMLEDAYISATPFTPRKTGDLRHRVVRQMEGDFRGTITWETPYAAVQEQGYRNTSSGRVYFRHYTTPGTGPKFAENAVEDVMTRLPEYLDKVGVV